MANYVQGRNIIFYMKISGNYYPVFCGKTMSYSRSQELLETTNTTSGSDKDYEAGMSGVTIDVTGVTILDNTGLRVSMNYLEQLSVRRQKLDFKITETDDAGSIHVRTFQGLISSLGFDRSIGSYSSSTATIQVCGPVIPNTVEPPATGNEVVYSDYWTFTAGATSISGTSDVHGYSLTGSDRTVLHVSREGLEHDIITTGTPGNRQCKHKSVDGSVEFNPDVPSVGETVFVVFKITL